MSDEQISVAWTVLKPLLVARLGSAGAAEWLRFAAEVVECEGRKKSERTAILNGDNVVELRP